MIWHHSIKPESFRKSENFWKTKKLSWNFEKKSLFTGNFAGKSSAQQVRSSTNVNSGSFRFFGSFRMSGTMKFTEPETNAGSENWKMRHLIGLFELRLFLLSGKIQISQSNCRKTAVLILSSIHRSRLLFEVFLG